MKPGWRTQPYRYRRESCHYLTKQPACCKSRSRRLWWRYLYSLGPTRNHRQVPSSGRLWLLTKAAECLAKTMVTHSLTALCFACLAARKTKQKTVDLVVRMKIAVYRNSPFFVSILSVIVFRNCFFESLTFFVIAFYQSLVFIHNTLPYINLQWDGIKSNRLDTKNINFAKINNTLHI